MATYQSNGYVEDNIIILPKLTVDNDISKIGDLWNCQTSKKVSENIFRHNLDINSMNISPIQLLDYELKHIKSYGDRMKTSLLTGEMDLEFLTELIEIDGPLNIAHNNNQMKNVEYLSCDYNRETFSIYIKPNADKLINEMVKHKILKSEIKATHFVRGVILGARLNAEITLIPNESNDKYKYSDIQENVVFGRVNSYVKASLDYFDSKEANAYSKQINIHSIPPIEVKADSFKDMFKKIDQFEKIVENGKFNDLPEYEDNLIGYPIRFILVPIESLIKIKITKLYLKISNDLISNFHKMMIKLEDIQTSGYIVKRINEYTSFLTKFISYINPTLNKKILEYEKILRDICLRYKIEAQELFIKYKANRGKIADIELEYLITRFNKECNSNEIFEKIVEFINEGKEFSHRAGLEEVDVKYNGAKFDILTSSSSLNNFLSGYQHLKILLNLSNEVPEYILIKFNEMVEPLMKLGAHIGIAIKSISSTFELNVNVCGKPVSYKLEQEISYVLSIMSSAVGVGSKNEIKLHSMCAEIFNTSLPFKSVMEITDVHQLIENLKPTKGITIGKTISETFHLITTKNGKWKCYMPLNAVRTSFLAIKNLRFLMELNHFKNVDWIAGNLGEYQMEATGLLFFIRKEKVKAICIDDLDVRILIKTFDCDNSKIPSILFPENLKPSLYPERTLNVSKTIGAIEFGEKVYFSIEEDLNLLSVPNSDSLNTLELACSIISDDYNEPLKKLAKFACDENSSVKNILLEKGYINNEGSIKNLAYIDSKDSLARAIKKQITTKINFSKILDISIRVLNEVIRNEETDSEAHERVNQALNLSVNNSECFEQIIEYNKLYREEEIIFRCVKMRGILLNSNNYFHLMNFYEALTHDREIIPEKILKNYINKINLNENEYDNVKAECLKLSEKKHFYQLITKLSECANGIMLFVLYKEISKYADKNDIIELALSLLKQLSDRRLFKTIHWEEIWKNNRFQHIMLSVKDEPRIISNLFRFPHSRNVIISMPREIAEIVDRTRRNKYDIILPKLIENFQQFTEILREIQKNDEIPTFFRLTLADSLIENKELKIILRKLNILDLFGYDSNNCLFETALDLKSIHEAIYIIDNKQKEDCLLSNIEPFSPDQSTISFDSKIHYDINNNPSMTLKEEILKICPKFKILFGDSIFILNKREFIKISPILNKPFVLPEESEEYFKNVIIYLIKKIKVWGCYALTADSFSELIIDLPCSEEPLITTKKLLHRNKVPFLRKQPSFNQSIDVIKKKEKPFSKLDAMVGIINSIDSIVAHEIFTIIGKFNLAIPLVIPMLYQENYRILLPLMTDITIKWSPTPGKIIENTLFTDKYKLIVTLRIGEVVGGKCGKSTIMNQILSSKNVFSCCGEPGGDRGKPITLDGSVELIWLTQETSSRKLWDSVLQNHYKSDVNEVILLANLHGNALKFEETLRFFKLVSTSFIVFFHYENVNDEFEKGIERLYDILGIDESSETVSYIAVDPLEDCDFSPEIIIDTSKLASDNNMAKVRTIVSNCLTIEGKYLDKKIILSNGTLLINEYIETKESKNFIHYIKENTCASSKKCLKLQKSKKIHDDYARIWEENSDLKDLINLVVDVLSLKPDSRIKAMLNIEKELTRLADIESSTARQEFITLYYQLQTTNGSKNPCKQMIQEIKTKLRRAMENIDNINIGLEHIFREIGKLYEIWLVKNHKKNPYVNTPKQYAELLIAGHAIELLDGDSDSISGPWLSAIFDNVYKQLNSNRIFVISIMGLQSSGKSTLMNALFSCKFAVSVGRCTRGLFIRLLLFEESIRKKLKVDAILIIDTEGLGAPERQNDVDADKKDRLMATFAMSISNLTLVNILGESMRGITQILQIAIVAMTRLEASGITPDIMIVQHLTERNDERITTANTKIGEALEEAINLSIKDNINLGVRDWNCLKTLKQTISNGDLFFRFRPFKNGATVNSSPSEEYHQDVVQLQNSILNIIEKHNSIDHFMPWDKLVQSFWDAVKKDDFMRFKDVKDLQVFLHRNYLLSKLKESIDSAFRYHHNIILNDAVKSNVEGITDNCDKNHIYEQLSSIPNCETQCEKCKQFEKDMNNLYDFVENKNFRNETHVTVIKYISKTQNWFCKLIIQMMSARCVQQVTSSKILVEIKKKLDKITNDDVKYDEKEINYQVEKIWRAIERETAEDNLQTDIKIQIINEITETYENPNLIIDNFEKNLITLYNTTLFNKSTISKKVLLRQTSNILNGYLDIDLVHRLESQLRSIASTLLEERETEVFQTGMISSLKIKVENIIIEFENSYELKFDLMFECTIHSFAIQEFHKTMIIAQKEWDKQHNPLQILRKDKSFYLNVIKERLKYGVSYQIDGSIAANCLLDAIKQRVIKGVDEKMIEEVLKIDWLYNPESVRVKYFYKLARNVKKGLKTKALEYFINPKISIEEWFKDRVNRYSNGNDKEDFKIKFKMELSKIVKHIKSLTNIADIKSFIEKYIIPYDVTNLCQFLDLSKARKDDFDVLYNKIIETLNDEEIHESMFKGIKFLAPAENERVMNCLGCTEVCPSCAALCFLPKGHENDEGETRKHHTCHQPMGMAGYYNQRTKQLIHIPCHKQKIKNLCNDNGNSVSWSEMRKKRRYVDWKFDKHGKNLNNMMKWFFAELNEIIAERHGLKPIHLKDKSKFNFGSLLAALRSKFTHNLH